MANTLITPSVIAREVMDRLYETVLIANRVHRDFEADFNGAVGDTITVRRPAQFTVNEFVRATGRVVQDATEASFTVVLDKIPDVSFAVTAEELTMKVDDFSQQFLNPAAEAIAQYMDVSLLTLLVGGGVTQTVGVNGTTPTDPVATLLAAGKILNDNKVPRTDRTTVVTTLVESVWAGNAIFTDADRRGDTEGIRDAMIGHKFGTDVMASTNLPAGGESAMFHRSAISLVTRTLAKPLGLAPNQVEVLNYKGFGLRVVYDYDANKKQDVVSIDALCGFKLINPDRAVKILG